MINKASRAEIREKKHRRIRHHLNGTATTPRLAVYRSNKHSAYICLLERYTASLGVVAVPLR